MFFFISPLDLRAPSADRRETLPRDYYLRQFYNASPKTRGLSPKKFWGQKHAKFGAILHNFRLSDREYLRNDSRYPKPESQLNETDSSRVGETSPVNFGPLSRKFGM